MGPIIMLIWAFQQCFRPKRLCKQDPQIVVDLCDVLARTDDFYCLSFYFYYYLLLFRLSVLGVHVRQSWAWIQ